jgi:hypothetical protein
MPGVTPVRTRRPPAVHWGPLRLDAETAVYETVVLMTVLVVALDDGIEDFVQAGLISVGPLVATFAAHVFAGVLARAGLPADSPDRATTGRIVGHAARCLWLAVGPLAIVVVGAATDLYTPEVAVDAVIWLGLAFLVVIGGVGGFRARHTVWATLGYALAAGVVGLIVLLLRLVLEH